MMLFEFSPKAHDGSHRAHGDEGQAALPRTAEEVFYRYAARVYGVARRMLGNAADAEDVTQDVLLQVVRRLDTFRGEALFTTWLDRVTVNAALAHRRGRARRRERQLDAPLDGLPGACVSRRGAAPRGPERVALDRETWALVERAIARMPEIYRDVYVLADVEGLANAEVGGLLGLSLAAVKSRLHRARLLMRAALAPYFESPLGRRSSASLC
jgi:RNA polymerase sigma-70 factor (ECF subfamily)